MALRYRVAREQTAEELDRRRDAALAVMTWVGAILNADEDVTVSVTGHQCDEPDCGGSGTNILLMRSNERTVAIRIRKPLEMLTYTDVAEALQPMLSPAPVIVVR